MKILIVCGHGEGDPGACSNGYEESKLTREVGVKLANSLSDYVEVTLFDVNKNMYKQNKTGNTFNFKFYDYVLELHFNAGVNDTKGNGATTGTEILVHTSEKGTSVENKILTNICKLGFKNRGIKTRNDLLNMNTCKKKQGVSYSLLEICFIDDKDDMKIYSNNVLQIVEAICDGIVDGFGLGFKRTFIKDTNKIVELLNAKYFPIIEKDKFTKELENAKNSNSSLYWGYYKLVNGIK